MKCPASWSGLICSYGRFRAIRGTIQSSAGVEIFGPYNAAFAKRLSVSGPERVSQLVHLGVTLPDGAGVGYALNASPWTQYENSGNNIRFSSYFFYTDAESPYRPSTFFPVQSITLTLEDAAQDVWRLSYDTTSGFGRTYSMGYMSITGAGYNRTMYLEFPAVDDLLPYDQTFQFRMDGVVYPPPHIGSSMTLGSRSGNVTSNYTSQITAAQRLYFDVDNFPDLTQMRNTRGVNSADMAGMVDISYGSAPLFNRFRCVFLDVVGNSVGCETRDGSAGTRLQFLFNIARLSSVSSISISFPSSPEITEVLGCTTSLNDAGVSVATDCPSQGGVRITINGFLFERENLLTLVGGQVCPIVSDINSVNQVRQRLGLMNLFPPLVSNVLQTISCFADPRLCALYLEGSGCEMQWS